MTLSWHFERLKPGTKVRDPIQGEFFASEAIAGSAEALIREGIQNAKDAARSTNGEGSPAQVRVRVFISEDEAALPPERMSRYTDNLWDHILAEGNGLKSAPTRSEPCRFLTFEDFGTTGLRG